MTCSRQHISIQAGYMQSNHDSLTSLILGLLAVGFEVLFYLESLPFGDQYGVRK